MERTVYAAVVDMVEAIPLEIYVDDRGFLFEVIRRIGGEEKHSVCHKFGQVYIVQNPTRGTVRAFHRHRKLWDFFCIIRGRAKFCFVDELGNAKQYVLTARKPKLIVVPPTIYHGWMSLDDDTILLSIASETYDRRHPDEERVPYDHFDRLFGGSPWRIQFR